MQKFSAMATQIKCPYCNKSFEPTEAYKHELEERLLSEAQARHQEEIKLLKQEKAELEKAQAAELEEAKKKAADSARSAAEKKAKQELEAAVEIAKKEAETKAKQNIKLKEELEEQTKQLAELKEEKSNLRRAHEQELEETKKQTAETARKEAEGKIRKELQTQISTTKEEAEAREKQNKELQDQLKEMFKQVRGLKDEKDKLSLEYEKKLLEGQDKIKQTAKREVREELDLKIAEKDKKLNDALKANEELRRKLEQGSQQLQGEVQELKLEDLLKEKFPSDEIKEVRKGLKGADTLQVVRTQTGVACGAILWESKRTQKWSPGWVQKLKEDQRAVKAELAVLVSKALPQNIRSFGMVGSVFVTDLQSAVNVAHLLRLQLMEVHSAYVANSDKATKAEVVYSYLISNEFKQRIEIWVEYFRDRREEIEKERAYYTKKWEKEEKSILRVANSTAGIYGDLQGLMGNALPKIRYLELPEGIKEKEAQKS